MKKLVLRRIPNKENHEVNEPAIDYITPGHVYPIDLFIQAMKRLDEIKQYPKYLCSFDYIGNICTITTNDVNEILNIINHTMTNRSIVIVVDQKSNTMRVLDNEEDYSKYFPNKNKIH